MFDSSVFPAVFPIFSLCTSLSVVPNFGKSKVESPGHGYRGTFVLIHSPMIVDGVETSDTESKFSLEALRDVIYFQCSLYPGIQR